MTISEHHYTVGVLANRTLPEELVLRESGNDSTAMPWTSPQPMYLARTLLVATTRWVWSAFPHAPTTKTAVVNRRITGLDAGREYEVRLQVRAGFGALGAPPVVQLGNGTAAPTTAAWVTRAYRFVPSASSHTLTFTVTAAAGGDLDLLFDNLTVTALAWSMPPVVTPLSLMDGTVTLDESWSPYVQASLTVPLQDAELLARLDPRTHPRLRVTATQTFGTSLPLSALTGATLADLSDRYAGQTVLGVSTDLGAGYNAEGVRSSTASTWELGIRSRIIDQLAGVVHLFATSDEGLLMDYAPAAVAVTAPTMRAAAAMVLARIGALLEPGTHDGLLDGDATIWSPGVTGWDFLRPLLDATTLRLYCDEERRWHLVPPLRPSDQAFYVSAAAVTQVEDQVSRDDGWFDAVTVIYRWSDSSGLPRVQYDVAAPPGYSKMMTIEYERQWQGNGAAAALLARARGRGQISQVETVSNYDVRPGALLRVSLPDALPQTGVVSRVEWRLSSDDMSVRSRDLAETPPRSWLAQPFELTWEGLPAGTSWNTYQ